MKQPLEVGGVGTGTQATQMAICHHIGLENGQERIYEAPTLPNSSIPALLGQKSLCRLRALLDCFNGKIYFVGPGGYKLQLAPGSETHKLEQSPAGHLMLPCSSFHGPPQKATEVMMTTENEESSSHRLETSPSRQ